MLSRSTRATQITVARVACSDEVIEPELISELPGDTGINLDPFLEPLGLASSYPGDPGKSPILPCGIVCDAGQVAVLEAGAALVSHTGRERASPDAVLRTTECARCSYTPETGKKAPAVDAGGAYAAVLVIRGGFLGHARLMSVGAELMLGLATLGGELPQPVDFPRGDATVVESLLRRKALLDLLLERSGVGMAGAVWTLPRSLLYLIHHLVPPRRGSLTPAFGIPPGRA